MPSLSDLHYVLVCALLQRLGRISTRARKRTPEPGRSRRLVRSQTERLTGWLAGWLGGFFGDEDVPKKSRAVIPLRQLDFARALQGRLVSSEQTRQSEKHRGLLAKMSLPSVRFLRSTSTSTDAQNMFLKFLSRNIDYTKSSPASDATSCSHSLSQRCSSLQ